MKLMIIASALCCVFVSPILAAEALPANQLTVQETRAAIVLLNDEKKAAEQRALSAISDLDGAIARNSQLDAEVQKLTKERDDLRAKYEPKAQDSKSDDKK